MIAEDIISTQIYMEAEDIRSTYAPVSRLQILYFFEIHNTIDIILGDTNVHISSDCDLDIMNQVFRLHICISFSS